MDVPMVETLRDAVDAVIDNNRKEKYPPTRFIGITAGKEGDELRIACEGLVFSEGAEKAVKKALKSHPKMWTLEDFLVRQGRDWGFSEATQRGAHRLVTEFDSLRK